MGGKIVMVRVKISGIRTWEEARMMLDLGIDILGFVFAPDPRQLKPEDAREIILKLPPFTTRVGIFVNEPRYSLLELATFCHLDVLQLHGDESPQYCKNITPSLIKGLPALDECLLKTMASYPQVKGFALDPYAPGATSGASQTANWQLLREAVAGGHNIILAGNLTPENVGPPVQFIRPYAVDVAGGIETNGCKDPGRVKTFLQAVRGKGTEQ